MISPAPRDTLHFPSGNAHSEPKLHRQECALFHKEAVNVRAIEAPQQHGEMARRRELKKANDQTRRTPGTFPAESVPSSSRHYPENGSNDWERLSTRESP